MLFKVKTRDWWHAKGRQAFLTKWEAELVMFQTLTNIANPMALDTGDMFEEIIDKAFT